MQRTLTLMAASVFLIATGVVHGLWTDRWNDGQDLIDAAKNLETIPDRAGDWEGQKVELDRDDKLGLAGRVRRTFVNRATGKRVTLYMAVGRPGPVSIHTPDVCYAAINYTVEAKKVFSNFGIGKRMPSSPELFTSRLVKKDNTGAEVLRIFWGWYDGARWQTAENPRVAFADRRVLYKMYVIRELAHVEEPLETEACVDFMNAFLPALESKIAPTKS